MKKFLVLKNVLEQYSMWQGYKEIPEGWEKVFESDDKDKCLNFVGKNWDLGPFLYEQK
jgi:uncharacterized protein YbdZ (MbtH family)